jgi:type 1 glutamine amidotransferase
MTITKTYKEKWRIKFAPWYKISECGKVFNTKTGHQLKEVYKPGMHGYCIQGKFWSKKNLRGQIELIPKDDSLHDPLPF